MELETIKKIELVVFTVASLTTEDVEYLLKSKQAIKEAAYGQKRGLNEEEKATLNKIDGIIKLRELIQLAK